MNKLTKIGVGITGVYLVAAELSKQGYIVTTTSRNAKGIDVLAYNERGSKAVAIQVKTKQGTWRDWILDSKAEEGYAKNLFYIFVNLNHGDKPSFFIVPSNNVANYIAKSHKRWLKSPGRKGRKHKDTRMRRFQDEKGKFLNRWELLGL